MAVLLDNFSPVTFSIGFLRCPFERVRREFLQWSSKNYKTIDDNEVIGPLTTSLKALEPLTAIPRRWLWTATQSNWVAYFDNCVRGTDAVPVIAHLAGELGCEGVVATSVPEIRTESNDKAVKLYGAVQFQMFAPHRTDFLNYRRTISASNDGERWRFDANGTTQPFERTDSYRNRRVVDRFTPEMLKAYCRALGIVADSPDFYCAPSCLISSNDPLPKGFAAATILQAQTEMGLCGG